MPDDTLLTQDLSILNSLAPHVAVLGSNGTVLATNDSWNRFAQENGANYLSVCRRAASEGVSGAEAALEGIRGALEGHSSSFHLEYPCHSLTGERWFLMSVSPLTGSIGGAAVTHVDITDRNGNNLKIEQAAQRQVEAGLAKEKLETVGALAQGIAHDFNNVLAGVLSHTELAQAEIAEGLSPAEELRKIQTAVTRGTELVRQLMIYAGQERQAPESINISAIVEKMLALLRVSISKRVTVQSELCGDLPAVRANPSQIRRLLMSLFSNASDAIELRPCEPGSIRTGPDPAARSANERIDLPRKTVLVVEDENLLREAVSKMLRKHALTVLEAADGSSALDLIRAQKDSIDLLFLDITLPGASSRDVYELARLLKPGLPVIITSAKTKEASTALLATRIENFLRKPYPIADLIKMIQELLSTSSTGR